jgi:hypothetical protein
MAMGEVLPEILPAREARLVLSDIRRGFSFLLKPLEGSPEVRGELCNPAFCRSFVSVEGVFHQHH